MNIENPSEGSDMGSDEVPSSSSHQEATDRQTRPIKQIAGGAITHEVKTLKESGKVINTKLKNMLKNINVKGAMNAK